MTGVRGAAERVESSNTRSETLEGLPSQEHLTHKGIWVTYICVLTLSRTCLIRRSPDTGGGEETSPRIL